MLKRVILALRDPTTLDDKDYYGNKRIETYVYLCTSEMILTVFQVWAAVVSHVRRFVQKICNWC